MKHSKFLISITVVVFLAVWVKADESVCNKTVKETKYKDEVEEYIVLERVDVKCPRGWTNPLKKKLCPELRNVTKERTIQKPYEVTRTVKVCCTGYERVRNRCVPKCQQACENSKCTGPDICTCKEGYTQFGTYRCVPACDGCEHGQCIAPGVCDCYGGYRLDHGVCHPVCDPPCETGICTEPNVCDVTEEEPSSTEIHGKSEPDYSQEGVSSSYEEPEEDKANEVSTPSDYDEDYKDEYSYGEDVTTSKTTVSTTSEQPIPSLTNPCPDGLALDSIGVCRLQCVVDCHFGTYDDGMCICDEGFRNSPVNHCVCEPYCDNECYNGLCTGNNTCLCDEGYKLNPEDNFICLDSTTCHCINGDCTDADHCSCWSGYELKYSEPNYHRCEALCGDPTNPEGCVNGKCVAPYLCQCNEGFVHGPSNNFTCYADMSCDDCLKEGLNCLPGCYTTTSTTTTTLSTESVKEVETTSMDDYIFIDFNKTAEDYEDENAPIISTEQIMVLYSPLIIGLVALLIVIVLMMVLLKRMNKPIDYDVNQREHSENNVYFIKRQDDVKLNL